jgi:hypothetical protein
MKCTKCGAKNEDDAKFCLNCGADLKKQKVKPKKQSMTKKQTIFTIIAVIGIIAIGASIHYSNILMGEPGLVGHDFDGIITMDVPEESNFVIKDIRTQNAIAGYAGFVNKGEYGFRTSSVMITSSASNMTMGEVIEDNGNMKITHNGTGDDTLYNIYVNKDNCQIILVGWDLDLMKKMANTIEVKNLDAIQPQTTAVPVTT